MVVVRRKSFYQFTADVADMVFQRSYFGRSQFVVCLCWGILNAVPLGPFNATLLEQLKNDYQKGDKEVTRYIELQEKVAEKYIKMTPLSVTAKKKLPPSKDPRDYMTLSPYWWPDSTKTDGLPYIRKDDKETY